MRAHARAHGWPQVWRRSRGAAAQEAELETRLHAAAAAGSLPAEALPRGASASERLPRAAAAVGRVPAEALPRGAAALERLPLAVAAVGSVLDAEETGPVADFFRPCGRITAVRKQVARERALLRAAESAAAEAAAAGGVVVATDA